MQKNTGTLLIGAFLNFIHFQTVFCGRMLNELRTATAQGNILLSSEIKRPDVVLNDGATILKIGVYKKYNIQKIKLFFICLFFINIIMAIQKASLAY
jgi:hypothetical protein